MGMRLNPKLHRRRSHKDSVRWGCRHRGTPPSQHPYSEGHSQERGAAPGQTEALGHEPPKSEMEFSRGEAPRGSGGSGRVQAQSQRLSMGPVLGCCFPSVTDRRSVGDGGRRPQPPSSCPVLLPL